MGTENRPHTRWIVILFAAAILAGCGGKQITRVVSENGPQSVDITASSFDFKPDVIKVPAGESVVFKIRNVSDSGHNFTIKNPGGEILESVDLPAKETREVTIRFQAPGTYPFHCDKPFHSTLGMDGQVVAE